VTVLPLILGALVIVFLGCVCGMYAAVLLGGGWITVIVCAIVSALLVALASRQFVEASKAGDGGMGDAIMGVVLILLVVGLWIGLGIHRAYAWPL
jgi:hypothetical protein